ncbi:MAG: hypothetical protein ACFCU6_12800 [Balneolaceae bacterium]
MRVVGLSDTKVKTFSELRSKLKYGDPNQCALKLYAVAVNQELVCNVHNLDLREKAAILLSVSKRPILNVALVHAEGERGVAEIVVIISEKNPDNDNRQH